MPQGCRKNPSAKAALSGLAARNRRPNEFLLGWTIGERGEVFDTRLLSEIAQLGIDLGIEPFRVRQTTNAHDRAMQP